jgi:hypothetical protein
VNDLFKALFDQVIANPASILIIFPVGILAFVLEVWPMFPSKLVLPVCLCSGSTLFPALVKTSTVPAMYASPLLVLILDGFILGFVAWLFHRLIIKKLIKRFANGMEFVVEHKKKTNDTEILKIKNEPTDPTI